MSLRSISFFVILAAGLCLVASSTPAAAQRRSSEGSPSAGGGLEEGNRGNGVEDKDDLKDFHDALAVQATAEQIAEYEALLKGTQAAQSELKSLLEQAGKAAGAAELTVRDAAFTQALEKARTDNKNFLAGFSDKQKSGLREITKRLVKADSEIAQQGSRLDQSIHGAGGSEVAERAGTLDKALANFYDQQIMLGREMSIAAANPPALVFALPAAKNPVRIGKQPVVVAVSGVLSQTAVAGGQHTFQLHLAADLTDLQQNATGILRAQLNRAETCGQRVDVRQGTMIPSAPASIVSIQLHFERWTCVRVYGQPTSTELAEGDGSFEVKLTPTIASRSLKLVPEFGRIDASGMLGESLRTGSLGEDLRESIAETVLSVIQAATDFKLTLPPAARDGAALQSAKFEDAGAGVLRAVLIGEVLLSDDQTKALASQLNETVAAEQIPPQ